MQLRSTELRHAGAPTKLTRPQNRTDAPTIADRLAARHELAWLCLIVAVAAALRIYRLGHQSFWHDEVLTALSSDGSMWWVLTQTAINTNVPPLYYAVVHLLLPLGHSEALLRLPSALCGVASVALLYLVVREWLGGRVALMSAALLAISPFHVWYSQEARPYALFLSLSLLSLWLLQQLLERPNDRRLQVGFVLSAAAVVYTHTLGLPFIVFLAAYVALVAPRERWKRFLPLFGAVGVLLLPALYRLLANPPTAFADANRSFSPIFVAYATWAFATGYSIGPTLTQLHLPDRVGTTLHFLPIIAPIALLFGTLVTAGAVAIWKRSGRALWIVALWLLVPLAFAVAGTFFTRHPFNARYVVLSVPAFLVLAAAGVFARRGLLWRVGMSSAVALVSVFSLANYFFVPSYQREDNRAAGTYLAAHAVPGDLVIADAPYTVVGLRYYVRRQDLTIVGYPPFDITSPPTITAMLRAGTAQRDSTRATGAVGPAGISTIISGRRRFWLFLSRAYQEVPGGAVLDFCDSRFRRVREFATKNDIRLILYQKQP